MPRAKGRKKKQVQNLSKNPNSEPVFCPTTEVSNLKKKILIVLLPQITRIIRLVAA